MLQWFKRFLGGVPELEKQQCQAKIVLGDSTFFCVKNETHLGPHQTYRGRWFWLWK